MIQQAEGLRHNPSLMLIDDADKPAKWYFALKQARLDATGGSQVSESRSFDGLRTGSGAPAVSRHPMDGPVDLHWRS
jgi:hypothetical protein